MQSEIMANLDRNDIKGILSVIGRCLFFSLMTVSFYQVSKEIGPFQIFFLAILSRFLMVLPTIFVTKNLNTLKTKFHKSYFVRALFTTLGFAAFINAIKSYSINEVTAITLIIPIITMIFASLFLSAKFSFRKLLSLLVGVLGVTLIVKLNTNFISIGLAFALLACVMWSLSDIVVKIQANTYEELSAQLLWSTIYMLIISFTFALTEFLFFSSNVIPNSSDMLWIIIASFFILLSNLALFLTSKYSSRASLVPFNLLKLLFTSLLVYLLFGYKLDLFTVLGSIVIISTTFYLMKLDRSERKAI